MKKPKFKLLKEFKDFISRGSVLDLAVGMIIGAAFTAIITAVVNNILQPLINWIPINKETGLITVLRDPVFAEDGVTVVTEALVINWGAVISAIITFLLTALVLFAIVKAINTAKAGAAKIKEAVEKDETPAEEAAPAEDTALAEEPAPAEPAPELDQESVELLKEIRDLLKAQQVKDDAPKDAE